MNNALIMSRRKIKRRSQSPSKQAPSKTKRKGPKHRDIPLDELKRIIEKSKTGSLSAEEAEKLDGAIDTLAAVTNELEMKGATVRRLRRLLFGPSSEKTSTVFPDETPGADDQSASKSGDEEENGSDTASSSDGAAVSTTTPANESSKRPFYTGKARCFSRPKTVHMSATFL